MGRDAGVCVCAGELWVIRKKVVSLFALEKLPRQESVNDQMFND